MARYAAIDVGSNSIRLMVAEVSRDGRVETVAQDRQVTRLGESVFRSGRISGEAMGATCEVLERFAKTYQKSEAMVVRAVATAAVRDASNQEEFTARASAAAGTHVEVISGAEEARLIHLGVEMRWPQPDRRILVLDIGGGSAEVIVAENGRLLEAFSKPLGAVRLKEVFLKNDPPLAAELRRLDEYIDQRLSSVVRRAGTARVDRAIATSATAAAAVCSIHRVPRAKRENADRLRATAAQIRRLYKAVSSADLSHRCKIPGIGPRRAEIIVPGVAMLRRVVESLHLPSLYYSAAGVRDGIVADLAGRGAGRELAMLSRDQRRETEALARHYGIALTHARKVAELARELFQDLLDVHRLAPDWGKLLEAAAYLHDAGHYVSDTRHHKHSYYLVANSDLPGFTDRERTLVAHLCRYHRKSPPAPLHTGFQTLSADDRHAVELLIPLLRLADGLDRGGHQVVDRAACRVQNGEVEVRLAASGDPDLEIWAAERVAELFRSAYAKNLTIVKER